MNFVPYIKTYLTKGGMTEAEINNLISILTE